MNTYSHMKKIAVILFIMLSSIIYAQENPKLKKIKTLRIAFISEKLALTSAEAEKFWPIFNEFESKQVEVRKQKRILNQKLKRQDGNGVSDSEMNQILADSENFDTAMQSNRKQFVANLQGVISIKKILMLKQLEEDFKRKMLQQIGKRERRMGRE